MTSNIVLTRGSTQVTISTEKIEEVLNNSMKPLTTPNATANAGSGPNTSLAIDLQQIERRFTIDGVIKTDLGTGDTSSSAKNKKSNLITIFQAGSGVTGQTTMSYAGTTYNISMEKIQITEDPTDEETEPSIYTVKFTAIQANLFGT